MWIWDTRTVVAQGDTIVLAASRVPPELGGKVRPSVLSLS